MNRKLREQDRELARASRMDNGRSEKVSGYNNREFGAVDSMMKANYPTTNIGTLECAARHGSTIKKEVERLVDDRPHSGHPHRKHFAAGGAGKARKGQY